MSIAVRGVCQKLSGLAWGSLDCAIVRLMHLLSPGLSPSTTCFIILAAAVALFVWNRLPVGIVAFGVTLALWATGLVDVNQAFAGSAIR